MRLTDKFQTVQLWEDDCLSARFENMTTQHLVQIEGWFR